MKKFTLLAALLLAAATARADDWLDRLDAALTFNAAHGEVRAHLSGLLDAEAYLTTKPAPGLLFTNNNFLFNPRLTLFFDAQIGSHFYAFAQARFDDGFDPGYNPARARFDGFDSGDHTAQVRLDEYLLSYKPWAAGPVRLQIGKFATVAGNWVQRHDSWESPFITAPLPYENLTGIWDGSAVDSIGTLLGWSHRPGSYYDATGSDKVVRLPIIWGPSYASGAALFVQLGRFDLAVEMKNASLSSRPDTWDATQVGFEHPAFTARFAFRPDPAWNVGASASVGPYLTEVAVPFLPPGSDIGDYREIVLAQDLSFAWHHWQIWAECFEARFEEPGVGDMDTLAYYIEAKYKFTPQLFGALRWNQQLYSTVRDDYGVAQGWGNDLWRIDLALTYRFTPRIQAKLQYSFIDEDSPERRHTQLGAMQFTVRF
jgi:hypothetical protein